MNADSNKSIHNRPLTTPIPSLAKRGSALPLGTRGGLKGWLPPFVVWCLVLATAVLLSTGLSLKTVTHAAAPTNSSSALNELLQARFQAATNLLAMEEKRLEEGRTTLMQVCEAARRVRDSVVELPVSRAERMSALTNYVAITTRLENHITAAVQTGAAPLSEQESARYLRLDAQIALVREGLQEAR